MFPLADNSAVYCDFESECDLIQDQEDDEDWIRLSARNLSGVLDHTFVSGINPKWTDFFVRKHIIYFISFWKNWVCKIFNMECK